jgi:hypothetical protein
MINRARQLVSLCLAALMAIAVIVGAFYRLSWFTLALLAWSSLALLDKRTALEKTVRLWSAIQSRRS